MVALVVPTALTSVPLVAFGGLGFPLVVLGFLWWSWVSFGGLGFPLVVLGFLWWSWVSFGSLWFPLVSAGS
jgi:hypothetical protein